MTKKESALKLFDAWYKSLKVQKSTNGPARGTIAAALVVLERMKKNFVLKLEYYRAPGGSQIKGVSKSSVDEILKSFGETRPFLKEGGRTNRGGPGDIESMLDTLRKASLAGVGESDRNEMLTSFQNYLVQRVREYHGRQRIKFSYDPSKTSWQNIVNLLMEADETGRAGPVAQYLVGAKLELRFPQHTIRNESFSTADDQHGSPGDFSLGDTAFHVTVSPMRSVYEKCLKNISQGLRVYLIVPEARLVGVKQIAEGEAANQISVISIETFVSQNLEELAEFSGDKLKEGFRKLLDKYNERVDKVETDKSLMIEIPKNLS